MAKEPFTDDILNDALTAKQIERKKNRSELYRKKALEEEKQKRAAENLKKRSSFIIVALLVFIIAFAVFGNSLRQISRLKKERDSARQRLDELNAKIEKLQDELARVTSPEYIEQQARNQLRMIYPGETLYVVKDKEE